MKYILLTMALWAVARTDDRLNSLNNIVYYKPDESKHFNVPRDNEDSLHILNTATYGPPTAPIAAIHARTLVERESLASVNTIYQDGNHAGTPVSFTEYYADCGDGQPIILATEMSPSFMNIEHGSPSSLTIKVGDHSMNEHVNPKYPGSRPMSLQGSPKINLMGKLVPLSAEQIPEASACFLKRHKDAEWWTPGNPIIPSRWMKFVVDGVYYNGGFSDTSFIGEISGSLYKKSGTLDGFNMMGRSDPSAEFWEGEISNYEQQFGEHSTLALISSTLLGRLRRVNVFYEKVAVKEDLTDNDVVTPGMGIHSREMYDTVISSFSNLRSKSGKKKRSMFKDLYQSELILNQLTSNQLRLILQNLQSRIDEVKQFTDDFISSHPVSNEDKGVMPTIVVYEEVKKEEPGIPDYTPHPHDRFQAKQLREQSEWSIARSEDIYLAHHPGARVPEAARNRLMLFWNQ